MDKLSWNKFIFWKKYNNKTLNKVISALFISFLTIPFIFISSYCNVAGRSFGYAYFYLIAAFGLYELNKTCNFPKWSKYYVLFIPLISFLFPFFSNDFSWIFLNQIPKEQYQNFINQQWLFNVDLINGIGYLLIIALSIFPCLFVFKKETWKQNLFQSLTFIFFVYLISIAAKFFWLITITDAWFCISLCICVISVDSFAYFGGKLFGNKIFKKKLAPKISPNKTIEGAIIGYITGFLILFLILYFVKFEEFIPVPEMLYKVAIPLIIPLVAIIGDLTFSMIKRKAHIKDFSNLIPEHGGLLDRFDSLIISIIVFNLLILI